MNNPFLTVLLFTENDITFKLIKKEWEVWISNQLLKKCVVILEMQAKGIDLRFLI
jgi:hypothetical protein